MKFSKSELDIIYQYAAPTKAETLTGMKEIVPVIKDLLTSYPSPALATASYPFVDLQDGITLRCKLFPSDKFAEIRLYFFYEIAYNGASDKSTFVEVFYV